MNKQNFFMPAIILSIFTLSFFGSSIALAEPDSTWTSCKTYQEKTLPSKSYIIDVTTDSYSAEIKYKTKNTVKTLKLKNNYSNPLPIYTIINEKTDDLQNLKNTQVKDFKAVFYTCIFKNRLSGFVKNIGSRWVVKTKSKQASQPTTTQTVSNQQNNAPVNKILEAEGYIQSISNTFLTIEKEGNRKTFHINPSLYVLINGLRSSLSDLQTRYKAKVMYDSSNNAVKIIAEK